MKILLVIDQFDQGNNGTTISARRFAQALAADGNEVRVAAAGKPARGKYPMPEIHFLPVADSIIRSQGMVFAKPNRSVLEQAIAWADVVHFMMPFAQLTWAKGSIQTPDGILSVSWELLENGEKQVEWSLAPAGEDKVPTM